MTFGLSKSQEALKKEFAEFARDSLSSGIAERHRSGNFDRGLWDLCGGRGVLGLPIAKAYGGLGLSAIDAIVALEGLAYGAEDGGLIFALGAQLLSCNVPVALHGTDEQKQKFLGGLCRGQLIASNAMTEAQGGSAVFQMESRAKAIENGYRLSGLKSYCANAPVSDLCLTYVLTDPDKGFSGGVSAFLLERERHRYQVTEEVEKLGLRTCSTGQISLDGLEVVDGDLLGKAGAGGMIFNQSMDWERIGLAAMHVGTLTRLLERCVLFARRRKSGDVAISSHQAVSHVLADIQTELEAARLLVYSAASQLDGGSRSVSRSASITKLFVGECFKSATVRLMQIHASDGYQADSEIGRCLQDALAATVYSGTSEIQRNIISRWMGC